MKAIKIPADETQPISVIDVEHGFENLVKAVGGQCEYIERFRTPLTESAFLVGVTDEEGLYHDGEPNRRAWPLYPLEGYVLKGTVLVLAEGMTPDGVDFIDFPDLPLAVSLVNQLLEENIHA